jgi:DNA-binding beta-propeller fold protein YncE
MIILKALRRAARVCGLRTAATMLASVVVVAAATASAFATPARFGTEGGGAGQFTEPRGVAVEQESGDVYVTDRNDNRIDKFGPNGEFLFAWGWGVADGTTNAPQVCTTTCFAGLRGPGAGQLGEEAEGIAVDNSLDMSHGDVYVVDSANHRVEKFGANGEFILMFGGKVNLTTKGDICLAGETCGAGSPGKVAGSFQELTGRSIGVDSTGTVYVGDEDRVQLFGEGGNTKSEIALAGVGSIYNLAVDAAKSIYVTGSEVNGVHKYNLSGTEQPLPRDEAGEAGENSIAVGPVDELFVNDLQGSSHHILAYNPAGEQLASFDAGERAEDAGRHGIAYSEKLKALYVVNDDSVRVVTPPPLGPFVLAESEAASKIQPTTATLSAMVNAEGPKPTRYHFEYGTSATYGESTDEALLEGGEFLDQPASAAVTHLTPRTIYDFRVVLTNGSTTTFGPNQTFTTLPPVSIDATFVSQVDANSARLEAELNPHGLPSTYRFEYGTTTAYGTSVPSSDASAGAGMSDVGVGNLIQSLLPETIYHFRAVAHNQLGTVTGPDRTFTTQGAGSVLPDGRAWELVSPPNKHGAPLEPLTEEGGVIQAAADGGALAYVALGPPETDPAGVRSPSDTQLLAARGAGGWSTEDLTTPHEEISIIQVGFPSEYKFFAGDLSSSAVEPAGATPLSAQTTERTPYRREANGEFVPLITSANVPPETKFGADGVQFVTASPDLSHVVLTSPQVLAPGFAPGFDPTEAMRPSLYELSGSRLQLISVLPDERPAAEAGLPAGIGRNNLDMRGAISRDGERVVFETEAGTDLYVRDLALGRTVQLDQRQPGAAGGVGHPVFQAASDDGARVFFTDSARLTQNSTAQPQAPDLYMCEVEVAGSQLSCTLSDLSIDHNLGEAANVQGEVAAIDATGTHVYFAANGVLTSTPNAQGEHAVPGVCNSPGEAPCNLYVYDTNTHAVSLVAVLSSGDDPDWAGKTNLRVLGNLTARSSPGGGYFTFMSQRSLTGYDNRDERTGRPDEEVFLFDATSGRLRCVSCDPTGARPLGVFDELAFPGLLVDHPASWRDRSLAGSIPSWTLGPSKEISLYQSRYLSDSGRMFFDAADALVPQDTNGLEDVYEFEPPGVGDCTASSSTFSLTASGCVSLISSGTSKEESTFLDASEDGDDVFFLTASRLSPLDVDTAFDVYDAHVCSAESPCAPPPPPTPPACEGDACQNPVAPPDDATPGSLTFHGPGNLAPRVSTPAVKVKAKEPTRAQKLTRALKTCKHKAKSKRAGCEKQARRKYGKPKTTRGK